MVRTWACKVFGQASFFVGLFARWLVQGFGGLRCQFALAGGFFRCLGVGAEPADFAFGFFGGALVVEVDQALEEFFFGFQLVFGLFRPGGGGAGAADEFFGQVVPAVGVEDGGAGRIYP
jgi:hypothetical protein